MSTKGRYALRIMIELSEQYGLGPVSVDVLSTKLEISGKYIHVLVSGLKSAGLLRGVRGPSGGYELAKAPVTMTALDVVNAVEGPTAPVDCTLEKCKCSRAEHCVARDVWVEVAAAIDLTLSKLNLEKLAVRQYHRNEKANVLRPLAAAEE